MKKNTANKSLLGNNVSLLTKTMIDPVGKYYVMSKETIQSLNEIQRFYTMFMASQEYEKIPNDYQRFLNLLYVLHKSVANITDPNLRILFQIVEDGLISAIHSYDLNYTMNVFKTENIQLKKTIEDILTEINRRPSMLSPDGNVCLQKNFTLAPLFSYYILLYGMPSHGEGFDQTKISNLLYILEKNNISPV